MTAASQQESESEREAREFFEAHGLVAAKVPTSNERTADYIVDGDGVGYLVEVKARAPPDEMLRGPEGEFRPIERSMRKDPKVYEYLRDAREQMRSLDPEHERLWLLWVALESFFDPDQQAERLISSLYGFRKAFDVMRPELELGCWYAGPAALDGFPEIDGVMVYCSRSETRREGMSFNVNEASPRVDRVLDARFVRAMSEAGLEPRVPSKRDLPDQIAVPRGLLKSGKEVAVLKHVQAVTGIHTLNFWAFDTQTIAGGRISLPKDPKR